MYRTVTMGTFSGEGGAFCQYVSFWKQEASGAVRHHRMFPDPSENTVRRLCAVLDRLGAKVELLPRGWTARVPCDRGASE